MYTGSPFHTHMHVRSILQSNIIQRRLPVRGDLFPRTVVFVPALIARSQPGGRNKNHRTHYRVQDRHSPAVPRLALGRRSGATRPAG